MSLLNRLKHRIFSAFAGLAMLASPAFAAGTLPLAMAQQIDINGQPLAACQVYFYVAGTVATPQNAYADFGLSASLGPQLSCDQTGRIPMFWLADGLIHVRLTDSSGLQIIDTTMQVLGPSSGGGGGGGTVDPTSIMATGDEKSRYGTGPLPGFVRENGLTIGNATSGATERANADTQALFIYLYGVDPNLVVSGGRTGNALNDYNANKTIVLPDMRGRVNAFLDDMGSTPSGRLTLSYFGCSPITLGCAGGSQNHTLTLAEIPPGIQSTNPSQPISVGTSVGGIPFNVQRGDLSTGTGGAIGPGNNAAQVQLGFIGSSGNNSITVTSSNTSGTAHPTVQPTMLKTIYMKL